MSVTVDKNVLNDLREAIADALQNDVSVNVPAVLDRLYQRHPALDVPTQTLEACILSIAQEFHAPMSFGRH